MAFTAPTFVQRTLTRHHYVGIFRTESHKKLDKKYSKYTYKFVISGFRRDVDEICSLLGF
jgi:hypothetical protein